MKKCRFLYVFSYMVDKASTCKSTYLQLNMQMQIFLCSLLYICILNGRHCTYTRINLAPIKPTFIDISISTFYMVDTLHTYKST